MISKLRNVLLCVFLFSATSYSQKATDIQLSESRKSSFQVRESANDGYIVKNNLKNITLQKVKTGKDEFLKISGKNLQKTYNVGKPDLPVISRLIEIPADAEVKVEVLSWDEEILLLDEKYPGAKILPASRSYSKSEDLKGRKIEIDKEIYASNSFYKTKPADIQEIGIMRYRRLGYLRIAPFQYNPVENKLKILNNLKVKVTFQGINKRKARELKKNYKNPFFTGLGRNTIISKEKDSKELIDYEPATYVIVSDSMFKEQLQPFIQWKKKKGFHVIEAYTNEIGTSRNEIRNYLKDLYENPAKTPPSFVLFVGDVEQIPAWSGTTDSHITDLYYCEYTGDYLPELYYGRFSAKTRAQLQPQIDKTLKYEKYELSNTGYLNNGVLVAGVDASYAPVHGNGAINYITEHYINTGNNWNPLTYLYNDESSSTVMSSNASGASSSIKEKLNAGTGIANYTAHCSPSGWQDPAFSISDVYGLSNTNQYGMWIGNCCLSVKFDEDECFGEAALRAENKGAIGNIGGSNSTYWDEDYFWGVGFTSTVVEHPVYEETGLGAYDKLFHQHGEEKADWYVTQGQIPFAGNMAVEASTSTLKKYYWEIYHLMGDPSLMPYLGEPEELEVSVNPAELVIGMKSFLVKTNPNTYVAFSMNGELLDAQIANEDGEALLNFRVLDSMGKADLVITAQNRQPYIDSVNVNKAEKPYVVLDSLVINDLAGDADSQVDYGEEITMDVFLSNLGESYHALDVFDSLFTESTKIVLTDSLEDIGQIDSSSTVKMKSAFSFLVSDSIQDQHEVGFSMKLEAKDSLNNSYQWNSWFNMTINAPELSVEETMMADTGGDNDGIIEAGESGLFKVVVANKGHDGISKVFGKMELTEESEYFTLQSDSCGTFSLSPNTRDTLSFPVTVNSSAPLGTEVLVQINIEGASRGQYKAQSTDKIIIGEIPRYYINDGGTVQTCFGYFYDSGGEENYYSNSEDYQITFEPETSGSGIKAVFKFFDVEENTDGGCWDMLNIYDASTTGKNKIGSFCNENPPDTIIASNFEGALTFEFVSDGYITKQGWYAEVSCTNLDSLVFTVTDGLEPVTDANIIIGNKSRVTDNQGQAIFYLEPGTYEYIVSKTGYAEARGKTKLDGTTITNIVMNPPLCKLAFNVMDENTKAVEGAEVSIGDSLKTTDADGKTSFLFSVSDYSYRVSKAGYTTEENNVNLGQDTTLDIQLYRIFEITFMAQDSITEDAIAGASISIDTFLFETGAEGTALADLAYGEYDYTVQADGYYNKNSSVVIDSEKSVNIKMRPLSDAVDNHGLAYNFRIYPNPVSGELYVETKYQPGTLVVQLYDLLGKVILSKQTDNHKLKFDVSDLPSGVYLLRLKQGKASQTRKLLIR